MSNLESLNNNLNLKNPLHLFALGMGIGLSPKKAEAITALSMIPLCMLFIQLPWYSQLAIIVFIAIICYCATKAVLDLIGWENRKIIVCDEFLGMLITVFMSSSWTYPILGFFVYRFFDTLNVWPSELLLKRYHNAFGETMDDVISGLFSLVVMIALTRYLLN